MSSSAPPSPPPRSHSPPLKPTAFRFKSKRPRSPSPATSSPSSTKQPRSSSHHHRHRHHHRRRHSHKPPPEPPASPTLDPDTAFRESLFDALADDEGAAFWESVYGQPIHTYSPYRLSSHPPSHEPQDPSSSTPATDALQRMTDDEYTSYVRAKMWEKSHGYILEEREKRGAERGRRKEQEREEERRAREREVWERRVDEVLGRKKKDREEEEWKRCWEKYIQGWEALRARGEAATKAEPVGKEEPLATKEKPPQKPQRPVTDQGPSDPSTTNLPHPSLAHLLPWPTPTLQLSTVCPSTVETFFLHAPQAAQGESLDLGAVLKAERVRWHPDKMQQRYGALGMDERTRRGVTAVWQIVDGLWGRVRGEGEG